MAADPDLRFLQANERTLLAWIRTGLGLMALGFALAKLTLWLRPESAPGHGGAVVALGILALVLGSACHVIGALRFLHARRGLIEGRSVVPGAAGPIVLAALVTLFGIGGVIYLIATS